MIRSLVSLVLIATTPGIGVVTARARAHMLFRLGDPRITEASGIARGIASPGVFYVENDSGDVNRFFAVDRRTGETAATVFVTGARNVDWEDLAVAGDRRSAPSVWLADIGDNDAVRRTVQLYELAEPHIDPTWRNRTVRVSVAREWQLRYPGGPVDAESLAVSPGGTPYIVTKSFGGATVYRVPAWRPGGAVQTVRRVGRISFHSTGTANPFGLFGQIVATGAAISASGRVFAVRTYSDVWAWRVTGSMADTLRHKPVVMPLPRQPQGEGLTVIGNHAVVDSEHPHTAVYAVRLPRALTKPPPAVAPPQPSVSPTAQAGAGRAGSDGRNRSWWIGGGIAAVAVLVAGLVVAARRRR
ncbi:MAG TPA: hypothetical protein VJ831_05150 [Jatrophihabitantaceae bacterium]|nr:hypothetical protein [Jatrophihabitantaceae bacterium]